MKETINVKSNGLRNELKEIRKSIDKLTEVLLLRQTNKQNEKDNYNCTCGNSRKLRESKHDDD
jgi:predicted SprT family Zn-dependent metalloprotease